MTAERTRRLAFAALAAGAIVAAVVLLWPAAQPTFQVTVPSATSLVTGNRITDGSNNNIGGITKIDPVDGGRRARLTIEIKEDRYWPLRDDSRIDVRYGGTASFSNRYLRLQTGTKGKTLKDGGTLPAGNVTVPVELDDVINQFTPDVRADMKSMIDKTGFAVAAVSDDVDELLPKTPPLARNLDSVFVDLLKDKQSLRTLVQSTQRTVAAVDRANPDLRVLLDGAATTFDAIADESDDLKVGLDRFPAALRQTRTTLTKASPVLRNVGALTDDIAPGVQELRRTTAPLTRTLATLRSVVPMAERALRPTHQRDVFTGGDLLREAGRISDDRLTSIFTQLGTQLQCVRPYTPEITMLGSVWGDWISPVDERDHLLRATLQNFLPAQYNAVPTSPGAVSKSFPDLEYGFPRPPGALAKQEWYQPECGAGPDAQDPEKDQEGVTFANAQQELPADLAPTARSGSR